MTTAPMLVIFICDLLQARRNTDFMRRCSTFWQESALGIGLFRGDSHFVRLSGVRMH